jgi:hypothetical protein
MGDCSLPAEVPINQSAMNGSQALMNSIVNEPLMNSIVNQPLTNSIVNRQSSLDNCTIAPKSQQ